MNAADPSGRTGVAILQVKALRERRAQRAWVASSQRVAVIEERLRALQVRCGFLERQRAMAQSAIEAEASLAGDWQAADRAEQTARCWLAKAQQQQEAVRLALEDWRRHQALCAQRWLAAQESTRLTRQRLLALRRARQAVAEIAEEEGDADDRAGTRHQTQSGERARGDETWKR